MIETLRNTLTCHISTVTSRIWAHLNILNSLQWRRNGRDGISNHQPHDCLLNRLFRRRSKKASKLRVTGHCAGNSPMTGELAAQMASNAENVSIWWRHHVLETSLREHRPYKDPLQCSVFPRNKWKTGLFPAIYGCRNDRLETVGTTDPKSNDCIHGARSDKDKCRVFIGTIGRCQVSKQWCDSAIVWIK